MVNEHRFLEKIKKNENEVRHLEKENLDLVIQYVSEVIDSSSGAESLDQEKNINRAIEFGKKKFSEQNRLLTLTEKQMKRIEESLLDVRQRKNDEIERLFKKLEGASYTGYKKIVSEIVTRADGLAGVGWFGEEGSEEIQRRVIKTIYPNAEEVIESEDLCMVMYYAVLLRDAEGHAEQGKLSELDLAIEDVRESEKNSRVKITELDQMEKKFYKTAGDHFREKIPELVKLADYFHFFVANVEGMKISYEKAGIKFDMDEVRNAYNTMLDNMIKKAYDEAKKGEGSPWFNTSNENIKKACELLEIEFDEEKVRETDIDLTSILKKMAYKQAKAGENFPQLMRTVQMLECAWLRGGEKINEWVITDIYSIASNSLAKRGYKLAEEDSPELGFIIGDMRYACQKAGKEFDENIEKKIREIARKARVTA